jgi:hypothetical protein
VRCGDHKVYWRTWGVAPPEGSTCVHAGTGGVASGNGYICDPPLIFDLAADPSEDAPLHASSAAFKAALEVTTDAKAKHIATLTPVEDQNGRGSDAQYALCEDPNSEGKPATKMYVAALHEQPGKLAAARNLRFGSVPEGQPDVRGLLQKGWDLYAAAPRFDRPVRPAITGSGLR